MPRTESAKVYTLTDGSKWTARQLADKLGLTTTACRYRLDQSLKVDFVMRKRHKTVGKKPNVNQSTMYARLSRGMRDITELAKKPSQGCRRTHTGYSPPKLSKAVEIDIKTRNAYCPISRLFMTMV